MKCCGPTFTVVTLLVAFFILSVGIFLAFFLPGFIEDAIRKNLVLSKDATHYKTWVEPPFALYTKYYLFNYTNAHEFADTWEKNGTKPKIQQIGPYVYRQDRRKTDVTFINNTDTVEFYVTKNMTFVPEMSNGTEEDMVTFPNILLRALAHSKMAREEPWNIAYILSQEGVTKYPFQTQMVGDFLFNGYVDPIVVNIRKNAEGPTPFEDDKFRLMKSFTISGPMVVNTGETDMKEYGQVVLYNNQSAMTVWPENSTCNIIRGTDGSMFPPKLPTDKRLYLFAGDMCRSLFLRFERQVDHYGLTANRFVLDPDTMANTNPEYECFCQSPINKCWGSGVFNVGQCRSDSQILMSLPHLYNTDYHIKNAIDGLAPDPEKHQFFIDIEPTTGVPLNVSSNMQLNIGVERTTEWFPQADNLPEIILPVLWISDSVSINETMAAMIKAKAIDGPFLISMIIPLVVLGAGIGLGLLGLLCSVYYMFKGKKTMVQPLTEKSTVHMFSY